LVEAVRADHLPVAVVVQVVHQVVVVEDNEY
jgi:hypothetical protein